MDRGPAGVPPRLLRVSCVCVDRDREGFFLEIFMCVLCVQTVALWGYPPRPLRASRAYSTQTLRRPALDRGARTPTRLRGHNRSCVYREGVMETRPSISHRHPTVRPAKDRMRLCLLVTLAGNVLL